jgi:DNA-binding NarL/FixJ family response regulator
MARVVGYLIYLANEKRMTHLTHVYAKLALTSRVQLAQQASRHLAG